MNWTHMSPELPVTGQAEGRGQHYLWVPVLSGPVLLGEPQPRAVPTHSYLESLKPGASAAGLNLPGCDV